MKKIIELPIIVCGEFVYPGDDYIELEYTGGIVARIAKATDAHIDKIVSYREKLEDIPLHQITAYLSNFGRAFIDPNNEIRKEAVEYGSQITGYSTEMIDRDYWMISEYLMSPHVSYNLLDAEFGSYQMLDGWVTNQMARVRVYPRGRAFHVLVGNVPLASMYSIFRSILTKNQTVVKLPSRDVVSALYFTKALIEINGPDHPISKALSVIYTPPKGDTFKTLIESSDVVCAWGKGDSLKSIKELVPHSVPYLEHGPKRSYSMLKLDNVDLDKAALRLAHDMTVYDQEACLSPQRLFVLGDPTDFIKHLKKWLNKQAQLLPKGRVNMDAESHLLRLKMEAKFRNWSIEEGDAGWTIIEADPYLVTDHPLGRTMFVHRINSIEDIIPFLDDETQTISLYPYDKDFVEKTGHTLCAHGVSRICETGLANYPREGFTWDAVYALPYFVRTCYMDAEFNTISKYGRRDQAEHYISGCYGNPGVDSEEVKSLLFDEDLQW
jgi:long-chain-fatty-acyl-CoA reductase